MSVWVYVVSRRVRTHTHTYTHCSSSLSSKHFMGVCTGAGAAVTGTYAGEGGTCDDDTEVCRGPRTLQRVREPFPLTGSPGRTQSHMKQHQKKYIKKRKEDKSLCCYAHSCCGLWAHECVGSDLTDNWHRKKNMLLGYFKCVCVCVIYRRIHCEVAWIPAAV